MTSLRRPFLKICLTDFAQFWEEHVKLMNGGRWGIMGYRGNMRKCISPHQMFLPEISSGSFNFAHMPPLFRWTPAGGGVAVGREEVFL